MQLCACVTVAVVAPDLAAPAEPVEAAAELFRALSSPYRMAIVLQLAVGERCVHELVEALGTTQPLISQHLRVLRGERVVSSHRRGREVVYRLADDHVAHIVRDAVTHASERNH